MAEGLGHAEPGLPKAPTARYVDPKSRTASFKDAVARFGVEKNAPPGQRGAAKRPHLDAAFAAALAWFGSPKRRGLDRNCATVVAHQRAFQSELSFRPPARLADTPSSLEPRPSDKGRQLAKRRLKKQLTLKERPLGALAERLAMDD